MNNISSSITNEDKIFIEERIQHWVNLLNVRSGEELMTEMYMCFFTLFLEAFLDSENPFSNLSYKNSFLKALMQMDETYSGLYEVINKHKIDDFTISEVLTTKAKSRAYLAEMILKQNTIIKAYIRDLSRMDNLSTDIVLENIIRDVMTKPSDRIRAVKELNEVRGRKNPANQTPPDEEEKDWEMVTDFSKLEWSDQKDTFLEKEPDLDVLDELNIINTIDNAEKSVDTIDEDAMLESIYKSQFDEMEK